LSLAERYRESYTYEDYKSWSGDWELIEGVPFAMSPSPSVRHQLIVSRLVAILTAQIESDNGCNCLALAEVDWVVRFDTVVRPDVAVVCSSSLSLDGHLQSPPVLIFEVVSKTSVRRDEELKFELYRREGVRFYALVYPELKRVKVYRLGDFPQLIFDGSDGFTLELTQECTLKVSLDKLFKPPI